MESADSKTAMVEYLDQRPFRSVAQTIDIENFDFDNRSFTVRTTLYVLSRNSHLRVLTLQLGKSARLPNEDPSIGSSILINNVPATYERRYMKKIETPSGPSLDGYRNAVAGFDSANDHDHLDIHIPERVDSGIGAVLEVSIAARVVKPRNVYFHVEHLPDGSLAPTTHCYTFKNSFGSNSSDWIPCFDDITQHSLFELNIRVPDTTVAQASGEHNETVDNNDGTTTYFFKVNTPTPIANIGFTIGCFDHYTHSEIVDVMFLCPPPYLNIMKHTVAQIGRVFEFFEELLSSRFPFPCFHMVFVYKLPDDYVSYTGLALLPVDILYNKKVIDVVLQTRKHIVHGIASQFFGCFVQPMRYHDLWLTNALARFMTMLYVERAFGYCEYTYEVHQLMKDVCEYENRFGKICLRPRSTADIADCYGNPMSPVLTSPRHFEMAIRKGILIVRMVHNRLGKEPFMKVLHRLINIATHNGGPDKARFNWYLMTVSAESFFASVTSVTGREMPTLIEQWIHGGGHAHFDVRYMFNKRRNVIELEVEQKPKLGRLLYTGPLTISVQETDGAYTHTIQIDKELHHDDLPCHSKTRNKKKKKVMLSIGEEVEIDFGHFDAEATILWIRIDPEMCLIRELQIQQALIHYEYLLQYERDLCAQLNAIEVFKTVSSTITTIDVLNQCLLDDRIFFQVRVQALNAIASARTKLCGSIISSKGMIEIFQEFYGSKSVPSIVASNNIVVLPRSLQKYAIQQPFAKAIATVREESGRCPIENVKFINNLLFYNDNSTNRFSDDFLRAAYIDALGLTLSQSENHSPDMTKLPEAVDIVITRIWRTANEEMMKPTYRRVVQVACLKVICELQRLGHIPVDLEFFWQYVDAESNYKDVRVAAIMCIVKLIKAHGRMNWFVHEMHKTVRFIMQDPDPQFVCEVLKLLAENPPFRFDDPDIKPKTLPINSRELCQTIWSYMVDSDIPPRIRLLHSDLFYVLYGRGVPELYSEPQRTMPVFRSH
uniref:Transcription initiation factor TFIID subunit 2 n=1 Tax=Panagrellus redivivus TaxID=6233 RepID=A0A7E4VJ80_PANRE